MVMRYQKYIRKFILKSFRYLNMLICELLGPSFKDKEALSEYRSQLYRGEEIVRKES